MSRLSIMSLCLLALVALGRAQSRDAAASVADSRQIEAFLGELQRAMRNDDRNAIASMVHYPITITIGGVRVPFSDSAALLARYEAIFTPALQESLASAVVLGQVSGKLGITAIVVPRSEGDVGTGQPEGSPRATSTTSGRASARRVAIRIGPRPTRVSGALTAGATDAYTVWLPKGKVLEVRLERVQNRVAVIHVRHDRTAAPLNPQATDGSRVVRGVAPESADYRIDVERTDSAEPAPLPYVLSLTLR